MGAADARAESGLKRDGLRLGPGDADAHEIPNVALEEVVGRTSHEGDCQDFGQEGRGAKQTSEYGLGGRLQVSLEGCRDEGPGRITADDQKNSDREAPTMPAKA